MERIRGKRAVALGVALALAVGALGTVAGLALYPRLRHQPRRPELVVASRWSWSDRYSRIEIISGELGADRQRGFVLFRQAYRPLDREGNALPRFVASEPRFFVTPDRSGALHVADASQWSVVLESAGGSRSVLEFDSPENDPRTPSLYFLGRRLDPAHLPRLATRGIAVPIVYGPSKSKAVVLADRSGPYGAWHLYGYLAGFSLPPTATPQQTLRRPLAGPGRALYRIDPSLRRLVRVGTGTPLARESWALPPRCLTVSERYSACVEPLGPNSGGRSIASIVGVRQGRAPTTLLRTELQPYLDSRWTFLAPAPDGRTLLLERDAYACGADRHAYFLPAAGGNLEPAVPDTSLQSEALGWLSDGSALVAVQDADCEGTLQSGIYQVAAPGERPEPVVATTSQDATLWGSS